MHCLFIAFVSLYPHYRMLSLIRLNDAVGRLSVNEDLLQLSSVYLVKYADGTPRLLDIPRSVEAIV
ncbi:MAG: hypothetical protein QXZ17_16200 [Nitrososphaerota archaeon]